MKAVLKVLNILFFLTLLLGHLINNKYLSKRKKITNTGMDNQKCTEMLLAHDIKPTANRIVILKSLAAESRPLSLSELEYKILTIDKSGVFRTLNLFKEHHLVHTIEDGSDAVRYELCRSHTTDRDDDMHVHFHCERCHQTFCLEDIHIPAVTLPEGFVMSTANYVVKGICPQCRKKRM